jgi:hypothetical protein
VEEDTLDALLADILASGSKGPEGLEAALERHRTRLSPDLAEAARDVFRRSFEQHDARKALIAIVAANGMYRRLGDTENALRASIDVEQLRFMITDRPEDYESIRHNAQLLIAAATDVPAPTLAFRAAVLAADCAYFISEAGGPRRTEWLFTTLEDLLIASERARSGLDQKWLVKFVDLLASATSRAMNGLYVDEDADRQRSLLTRLAAAADELIPADFKFPGNADQTARIAAVLTELASEYGA